MKVLLALLPALLIASGCEPLVYRAGRPTPIDKEPDPGQAQRFVSQIARQRPSEPIHGIIHGEPIIADYTALGTDDCGILLITYQNLDHSETWKVCASGTVSRSVGGVPKLPMGSDFVAVRHAATQMAWLKGKSETIYADYLILARNIGLQDDQGCETVENTVMWNGQVVDARQEPVCGER